MIKILSINHHYATIYYEYDDVYFATRFFGFPDQKFGSFFPHFITKQHLEEIEKFTNKKHFIETTDFIKINSDDYITAKEVLSKDAIIIVFTDAKQMHITNYTEEDKVILNLLGKFDNINLRSDIMSFYEMT